MILIHYFPFFLQINQLQKLFFLVYLSLLLFINRELVVTETELSSIKEAANSGVIKDPVEERIKNFCCNRNTYSAVSKSPYEILLDLADSKPT